MAQGFTKDYVVKATGETEVFVNGVLQTTTSGAFIDFAIPSGVKKISIQFSDVSHTANEYMGIRIGDSSGVKTTGYNSAAAYAQTGGSGSSSFTDAFRGASISNLNAYYGSVTLTLLDEATNKWICHGVAGSYAAGSFAEMWTGNKALDSELTTVRILAGQTTAVFDAGSINIQYENPDLAVSGVESVAAGVTDVFVNGTKVTMTATTAQDFVIPSGVKEFSLLIDDASFSGTSNWAFQLGTGGLPQTTGYRGNGYRITATTAASGAGYTYGLVAPVDSGTSTMSGIATFKLLDPATNTWACTLEVFADNGSRGYHSGCAVSLSGECDIVRFTTQGGTATFDSGSMNLVYDNQELDLGSGVISGGVVQTVHNQTGEVQAGTGNLNFDNTVPQSTEGFALTLMDTSITPKAVGNKLRIDVTLQMSNSSTNTRIGACLFKDSETDARACGVSAKDNTTAAYGPVTFTYWMTAGQTTSMTFKIRVGASSGTTTLNGVNSGRIFGGAYSSSVSITEYKV